MKYAPAPHIPQPTPWSRLAGAVIEQAIDDLRDYRMPDAARYVLGGDAAISFRDACQLVGLDPQACKDRLLHDYPLRSIAEGRRVKRKCWED